MPRALNFSTPCLREASLNMLFKWSNTHFNFCYVWSIIQIQSFSCLFKKKTDSDKRWNFQYEICYWDFHLYDLLSGPAIRQSINKNVTFICISNWGESTKIKHFHSFVGISHSLCAPKTARHTSCCLSSRVISWKGHKKRITCY